MISAEITLEALTADELLMLYIIAENSDEQPSYERSDVYTSSGLSFADLELWLEPIANPFQVMGSAYFGSFVVAAEKLGMQEEFLDMCEDLGRWWVTAFSVWQHVHDQGEGYNVWQVSHLMQAVSQPLDGSSPKDSLEAGFNMTPDAAVLCYEHFLGYQKACATLASLAGAIPGQYFKKQIREAL